MYTRYLNLPRIPDSVLSKINYNFNEYNKKAGEGGSIYSWTDDFNQDVNAWCQSNICDTMYWAFQIIRGDLEMHKDTGGTLTKLIYLLETGGSNVATEFYADDKTTLLESVVLEPHRWHILKADTYHGVSGVEPGKIRFSITGRVFGN